MTLFARCGSAARLVMALCMNKSYPGAIHISSNMLIYNGRLRAGPSPDRSRLIALVQPLLRRDDVHAPQPPVVAVGGVGVLLHLERVVFDVVYGGQDDAGVILLHPGQNGLGPCGGDKRRKLGADFCRIKYSEAARLKVVK